MVEDNSLNDSLDNNNNNSKLNTTTTTTTNNIMDVYLKKHSLDLKVIPNRNMIKLSDVRGARSGQDGEEKERKKEEEDRGGGGRGRGEDEDEDEYEEEDEHENENDSSDFEQINNDKKRSQQQQLTQQQQQQQKRKKREPSLKLQQKLTSQDLELIVNCVRTKQARVFIADVNKTGYVDKILRIEMMMQDDTNNNKLVLSNGRSDALLKKSMFPKELTTLFDAFVGSLCGQESVRDERTGMLKPVLKCLVEECGFKSISEAEINRHIKR